jgi:hypothetical protein
MEELTQQFLTVLEATQHSLSDTVGNTKGGSITVLSTSCLTGWFGISCMTTDNFCFYLQNRLSQTKQGVNGTVILPPLVFPGHWHIT